MRGTFLLVGLLLFLFNTLYAQQKLDYVWPLGYGEIYQDQNGIVVGGVLMDFKSSPPSFSLHSFLSDVTRAGICDTSGQLLAYTDGCRIYRRDHELMLNGDTLNPGKVFNLFCGEGGYPLWQGCLFLPKPGSSNIFYLFHLRKDNQLWNPMDLLYSVVYADGDNGNGRVISKNQPVLSDSIWLGNYISATRHGNGRDWWVVTPRRIKNDYHVSLFTPEGVSYQGMQTIGDTSYQFCCGQTDFSPDGSKFFRHWPEGLQILDFDRCTGVFSNPLYIDYSDFAAAGGVAVSPSGRFLYVSKSTKIYQYDLWATDLVASRITVAEYDGYVSPFETYFFQARLAPDGKIYMISSSTNNILHVVHDPDSLGLACNVEQHGVTLPALTSYIMPNFANYRLYDLPGSPCDTLGISVSAESPSSKSFDEIRINPNPAQDIAQIQFPDSPLESIQVFDAAGRWVQEINIQKGSTHVTLDVSGYVPGLYFLRIRTATGEVVTRALAVVR